MKTSLNSKALVLSLSVLVLIGSGCERRGRAPIKSVGSGPSTTATDPKPVVKPGEPTPVVSGKPTTTTPTTTTPTTTTPTTTTVKPEVSDNEAILVTDAQMVCDVAAIDTTASASKESFLADLNLVNAYRKCMKEAGLVLLLTDPDKTNVWTLDSSPKREDKSAAFLEFAALSKKDGSNDDAAYKIMASRLELSILRLSKMTEKYSAERLTSANVKATEEIDYFQTKITIDGTIKDINKAVLALIAAREDIKAMKSVDLGDDLTENDEE